MEIDMNEDKGNRNQWLFFVIMIAASLILYALLVRAMDIESAYIPTEPDDPAYIKSLPELIGDPCRVHDLNRCDD
tara:strand:- start:1430 stop:1654 length:225 start_codon:yes stop_codon:yes gene_type:complete